MRIGDLGGAWRRLADREIDRAMERGDFDNLPGAGKPIPNLHEPVDEHWWIRRWLKRNQVASDVVSPTALRARTLVGRFLESLVEYETEQAVRDAAAAVNAEVARINAETVTGPATNVAGVNVEVAVSRWRASRGGG